MAAKTHLSKGILDMKFMKRTKDKVEKAADDAEGRAMYAGEITDRMLRHGESAFVHEPSFVPCENLREGRFSFGGMNPEIERLLELEELARRAARGELDDVKKDVGDAEMADNYTHNAAAQTMAKAFHTKRGHHASHHHQQQQHAAGGFRRKLNQPPQQQQNGGKAADNGYNKYSQQRYNGGGAPKKPRFMKPQQD